MAFAPSSSRQDALSQMNITPLVDVMLVLLVIFMIATPLMLHRTKVDLPQAMQPAVGRIRPPPLPVTVAITEEGRLFLDDEPATRASLESRLSVEAQKQPQPVLNIRGDKATRYRDIDAVVEIARAQGLRTVGFVATPERD